MGGERREMTEPQAEKPSWFKYFLVQLVSQQTGQVYVLGLMINQEEMVALQSRELTLWEVEKLAAETLRKLIEKYVAPTAIGPTEEFLDCNDYALQAMKKDNGKVFLVGCFQAHARV